MKNKTMLALAFVIGTSGLFAAQNNNDFFIPTGKKSKSEKEHKSSEESVETGFELKRTYQIKYKASETISSNSISNKELKKKLQIAAVKNYVYIQPEIIGKE